MPVSSNQLGSRPSLVVVRLAVGGTGKPSFHFQLVTFTSTVTVFVIILTKQNWSLCWSYCLDCLDRHIVDNHVRIGWYSFFVFDTHVVVDWVEHHWQSLHWTMFFRFEEWLLFYKFVMEFLKTNYSMSCHDSSRNFFRLRTNPVKTSRMRLPGCIGEPMMASS